MDPVLLAAAARKASRRAAYGVQPYGDHSSFLPTTFTRHGTAAITTFPTGVGELAFPTVLKVDELIDSPIDNYYMWCAPHDESNGGIYLYTAPAPLGPWTLHSQVLDETFLDAAGGHISSPHVIWVPEEQEFYLYLHASGSSHVSSGQPTWLATGTDGQTWTLYSTTPVIPCGAPGAFDDSQAAYFRPFRVGRDWFGYYQAGQVAAGRGRVGFVSSEDGKTWEKYPRNPVFGSSFNEGISGLTIYLPTPIMVGNVCHVLYVARAVSGKMNVYLATTTDGVSFRRFPGNPVFEPSAAGWDSNDVTYPHLLLEGDRLYLYYVGDTDSVQSGRNIGVAYANLEVVT